jgi:CRP/FNR family transcriptional regulator
MITKNPELTNLLDAFPFLKDSDKEIREQMLTHVSIAKIPKGNCIFLEGDECRNFALILSGMVRVYKLGESGREITLYRLHAGDSCILTASCILSQNSFPAIAAADEEVEAALVPSNIFREWTGRYEIWRNYVFNLLAKSLSSVMATLEEVAFQRMDVRIAEYIMKLSKKSNNGIKITHQDIAMELGTSREVVSRILKHFEYDKLITLQRGVIILNDVDKFRNKTSHEKF